MTQILLDQFNRPYDPEWTILVGCEKSLFDYKGCKVNEQIVTFMDLAKDNGYDVILFSGDAGNDNKRLQDFCKTRYGHAAHFGRVRDCAELQGMNVFLKIDGNDAIADIPARFKNTPDNHKMLSKMSHAWMYLVDEVETALKRAAPTPAPAP